MEYWSKPTLYHQYCAVLAGNWSHYKTTEPNRGRSLRFIVVLLIFGCKWENSTTDVFESSSVWRAGCLTTPSENNLFQTPSPLWTWSTDLWVGLSSDPIWIIASHWDLSWPPLLPQWREKRIVRFALQHAMLLSEMFPSRHLHQNVAGRHQEPSKRHCKGGRGGLKKKTETM